MKKLNAVLTNKSYLKILIANTMTKMPYFNNKANYMPLEKTKHWLVKTSQRIKQMCFEIQVLC